MTDIIIKPSNSDGSVKLQTEGGTNGLTMANTGVLTTSGNVAVTGTVTGGTLGTGVTNNAGVASGTIASGVTIASGINMPDFDLNLSSGQNRIITFGSKGFQVWGMVDATGIGNSSARTGLYGANSVSGSFKIHEMSGTIIKTGTRNDVADILFTVNTLNIHMRQNGYAQGPSVNATGTGTLSPSTNRWSGAVNTNEDHEIQLASADGGTFYYCFFGTKA